MFKFKKKNLFLLMFLVVTALFATSLAQAKPDGTKRIITRNLGEGRIVTIEIEESMKHSIPENNTSGIGPIDPLMFPECSTGTCVDSAGLYQTCSNGARLKYHTDIALSTNYYIHWSDYWWGGNPGTTGNRIYCSSACNITIDTNWSAYYTSAEVYDGSHPDFGIDSWACK